MDTTNGLASLRQLFYCPHSAQTEQSGEAASLISLSQPSQFHFVARPNLGRVRSRSHDAVIRVYDATGNVIETHRKGTRHASLEKSNRNVSFNGLQRCGR
jgi:hypothetical protein